MEKDIVDCLLNEECSDTVTLTDEDGKKIKFEQIAEIPYDNNMYAILVEKSKVDAGEIEDAGRVFFIDEEKRSVIEVDDDNIINEVFDIYNRLFDESEV